MIFRPHFHARGMLACVLMTASVLVALSGCVLPGDRLDRAVEIQGGVREVREADKVTVVQLPEKPSRLDLSAFADNQWPGVAPSRIAQVMMRKGLFAADFQPYSWPQPIWILPPLPVRDPDYVIRFTSTAATYLLRQSGSKFDVFLVTISGGLKRCRDADVSLAIGPPVTGGYAEMKLIRVLLP